MSYKEILETAVASARFSLTPCLNIEGNALSTITSNLAIIKSRLDARMYKLFKSSIIRSCFFIELTNPTAESDSTKYRVRWYDILENDVRYATYEDCISICEKITNKIASLSSDDLTTLKDYCQNSIFNYELPIDYIERHSVPMHCANNMDIFINDTIKHCTKVRKLIKDSNLNPVANIFKVIIADKIEVKSYKTDRAQTGAHQTNREKRWEAHPDNYQFAFRRDCNNIETSLILQVCMFEGANPDLVKLLKDNALLPQNFELYKCPITGEVLKYADFENEIINPVHGKSSFQVGHLNPLKSTGGHNAENIGWISDDGNRIQGSLSMEEVNSLLKRIFSNRPELQH